MMMTILPPGARRGRRRRRVGLAGLAAVALVLTGGAWANAQGRYVLLLVDARTGEVVTRADPDDLKLPDAPRLDLKRMADSLLRGGARMLADRLRDYADEPPAPAAAPPDREAAQPVLAGGLPPTAAPPGLKIIITDSWAQPNGLLSPPGEGGGG